MGEAIEGEGIGNNFGSKGESRVVVVVIGEVMRDVEVAGVEAFK